MSERALFPHRRRAGDDADERSSGGRSCAARRSSPSVVLVLLAIGAGRTVMSRMSNAQGARSRAPPSSRSSTCKTAYAEDAAARARRSRCPARCRATCRRRSRRARAATCKRWHKDIGSRVDKGRAARRDRDARDRPAALAGDRRAPAGGVEPRAREEHDRALGSAAQEGRGLAAGARRAPQRRRAGAREPRRRRRERRAAAPAAGLQARRRAVRRRDHAAQRRRRRPDRCRRRRRPRAVRAGADRPAARLRQRAAVLRAAGASRASRWSSRRPSCAARRSRARSRARRRRSTPRRARCRSRSTLPNSDGALLPGAYVQVALPLQASQALTIPTNALLIRGEGMRVAVVDAAGPRAACAPIKSAATTARASRCSTASTDSDRLVLNPSDSLADGDQVVDRADARPRRRRARRPAAKAAP